MAFAGAIFAVAGAVISYAGQAQQAAIQKRMAKQQAHFSKKAESAREQQMLLESNRQKRQAFRESLLARATALSVGVAQGAQHGSAVQGGMAQATATGRQTQQTSNAAANLGSQVFQANRQYADATMKGQIGMADAGKTIALGGMISSFSGAFG